MRKLSAYLKRLDAGLLTLIFIKWTRGRPTHHFSLFGWKGKERNGEVYF